MGRLKAGHEANHSDCRVSPAHPPPLTPNSTPLWVGIRGNSGAVLAVRRCSWEPPKHLIYLRRLRCGPYRPGPDGAIARPTAGRALEQAVNLLSDSFTTFFLLTQGWTSPQTPPSLWKGCGAEQGCLRVSPGGAGPLAPTGSHRLTRSPPHQTAALPHGSGHFKGKTLLPQNLSVN
ncbi:unnamed protein product [Gadus morhua 'NCC']